MESVWLIEWDGIIGKMMIILILNIIFVMKCCLSLGV